MLQIGFQSNISNSIANNEDPNETAHYELSHLDLHCLQRCLYWYIGMKRLRTSSLLSSFMLIFVVC